MKVRFYRGPLNGRTRVVPDHYAQIVHREFEPPSRFDLTETYPLAPLKTKDYIYLRTRHTHPDGSVFFEWAKPRRP